MEKETTIFEDGRHYDAMVHFEGDVPFYKECIDEYGDPVLELACGTGRITVPLAEEGIDITGIDVSEPRLELAREKASKKDIEIDFIKADMKDFSLDKRFKTIIIPVNSIQILTEIEEYEVLFSKIHDHLAEDGRLILQIFNPNLDILQRDPDEEFDVTEYDDPYGEGKIKLTERSEYRSTEQVLDIDWMFYKDGELLEKKDWELRIIFPKEMDALLKYNGFEVEHKYGDYEKSEFKDDSETQIIVCKKRE